MDIRFDHLILFAVGDFDHDEGLAAAALAARGYGSRVLAFGVGSAAARRTLKGREIDVDGVGRSRRKAGAALEGLFGVWDAILVSDGWQEMLEPIAANEREQAFLDVRVQRPVLRFGDPQYRFLRTPAAWGAYTVARGAGIMPEEAKEFVRQQSRGHKRKDRDGGAGRGNRAAKTRAGKGG